MRNHCLLTRSLLRLMSLSAVTLLTVSIGSAFAQESVRQEISLNGEWSFRRDGDMDWKTVAVPSDFESHEGEKFDGIGWYRRSIDVPSLTSEQRLVVTLHAAATETDVFCNGQKVGSHLGGWTPFECDITDAVRTRAESKDAELLIRVDERVGHNSQGFLPVFAPHFGGLWQDVTLSVRSFATVDSLQLAVFGDPATGRLQAQIPVRVTGVSADNAAPMPGMVQITVREKGLPDVLASSQFPVSLPNTTLTCELELKDAKTWSPADPVLYDVDVELLGTDRKRFDQVSTRAAFRSIRVDGDRLLLNGRPLQVRGILNWGYAPPQTSPSRDPQFWKKEIRLAKDYGFNLMKFCLWVPPKKYLELCDESGMLAWMEYPTWHSRWTPDQLPTLEKEFTEFFHYDRIHPSVVLRSLTCETGTSADLNVIRTLYDLCHQKIPGSVVEDDSSWIEWNRVHDFYDDHPYGNNHTWPSTLERLKKHIAEHGVKPLVLGEAIAADTWVDPSPLLEQVGESRPFWLPGFLDANAQWLQKMSQTMGPAAVGSLQQDSEQYAMKMRKYQIETYRREVPHGGYVVSVVRDFPFAGMGLMDFQGQPKWQADAWGWHGDRTLIFQTDSDRRSFRLNEALSGKMLLSNFGSTVKEATLELTLTTLREPTSSRAPQDIWAHSEPLQNLGEGTVKELAAVSVELSERISATVTQPQQLILYATLESDGQVLAHNGWTFWITPPARPHRPVIVHDSVSKEMSEALASSKASDSEDSSSVDPAEAIHVASQFDADLMKKLEDGASVLMIPDGERGSFPLSQHWFLRGGPVIHPELAPWHFMLADLQHFDLAGPVVPDLQWLSEMRPLVMLWDNHDIKTVKTHGLVFQTQVGKGRLLVSALKHDGTTNAAGEWLLHKWLSEFDADWSDVPVMKNETVSALRGKLVQQKMDLTDMPWLFRIDADNKGLDRQWQSPETPEPDQWKSMAIGKHWEGLGYPTLDGWAWYRIEVSLPDSWKEQPVYVCVEGADDHYEVYVNGKLMGSAGDIAQKKTAFEERSSFEITEAVADAPAKDGQRTVSVVFRVYDWYGAGGLFRPIFLSTTPISSAAEIIR